MESSTEITRGASIGLGLLVTVALGVLTFRGFAVSADAPASPVTAADRSVTDQGRSAAQKQATGDDVELAKATFAGGCFWCMEPPFDELEGVVSTTSGYIGGHVQNPTYQQVSSGSTGHLEAVQIEYDPGQIDYTELLEVFWRNVDPTDAGGQFCDRGQQYTTAIFYHNEGQQRLAEASKRELEASGRLPEPIVTEIRKATTFYPAEEYHQGYYQTHPIRYKFYRFSCGRDRVLERLWG